MQKKGTLSAGYERRKVSHSSHSVLKAHPAAVDLQMQHTQAHASAVFLVENCTACGVSSTGCALTPVKYVDLLHIILQYRVVCVQRVAGVQL